jgi:quinol monooxygenase YgiN
MCHACVKQIEAAAFQKKSSRRLQSSLWERSPKLKVLSTEDDEWSTEVGQRPASDAPIRENGGVMELFIFARFHAREGHEATVAAVLREQVKGVREEPGCLAIHAYLSVRDPRLFYIHSRWMDEAAFEVHAELPRTVRFVERMETLIDHPFEATRAGQLE